MSEISTVRKTVFGAWLTGGLAAATAGVAVFCWALYVSSTVAYKQHIRLEGLPYANYYLIGGTALLFVGAVFISIHFVKRQKTRGGIAAAPLKQERIVDNTRLIVATALMAALCYVVATLLRVELGGGIRFHFGPTPFMLASVLLGPIPGALAGAIGLPLMNVTAGTIIHAPAQFIMRGIQGLLCGWIAWGGVRKGKEPAITRIAVASAVAAAVYFGLFMIYSYFIDIPHILGFTEDAVRIEMIRRIPNSTAMAVTNAIATTVLAPGIRAALKRARLDYRR
jgi:uncharacterized membrane protein